MNKELIDSIKNAIAYTENTKSCGNCVYGKIPGNSGGYGQTLPSCYCTLVEKLDLIEVSLNGICSRHETILNAETALEQMMEEEINTQFKEKMEQNNYYNYRPTVDDFDKYFGGK